MSPAPAPSSSLLFPGETNSGSVRFTTLQRVEPAIAKSDSLIDKLFEMAWGIGYIILFLFFIYCLLEIFFFER
jgi:hypothetical protein